ncbi:hypothetical protein D3C85_1387920 [compost metagenome]
MLRGLSCCSSCSSIASSGVMPTPPLISTTGVLRSWCRKKSPIGGARSSNAPTSTVSCSTLDTMPAGVLALPPSRFTEMRSAVPPGAADRLYCRGCIMPSAGTASRTDTYCPGR